MALLELTGVTTRSVATAEEALTNARIMQRPTEIVVASTILARIAARSGDARGAAAHLAQARALTASGGIGARGRVLLQNAEKAIDAAFPTLVHTLPG